MYTVWTIPISLIRQLLSGTAVKVRCYFFFLVHVKKMDFCRFSTSGPQQDFVSNPAFLCFFFVTFKKG